MTLKTPVVLLLFNRPDKTARVFEVIRAARPQRLLLVADGPRSDQPEDRALVAAARAVCEKVDWHCEVQTQFADENLGPKRRGETGLDWVFGLVERAIILEDDCVPSSDFFDFCETLLERFASDERIWSISGNEFQPGLGQAGPSYWFSRYLHVWGWATWRRAWRQHDPAMKRWPAVRDSGWLREFLGSQTAAEYWSYLFQLTYDTGHAWDYPLVLSGWLNGALHIHPTVNLVTNIGFGEGATHTRHAGDRFANLPTEGLSWPLVHPDRVERDAAADDAKETLLFGGNLARLKTGLRGRLKARPHA